MYFTECARLAEHHPDLAGVIEKVDAQLRDMGTAPVIRTDDLASFLEADPNQVTSVLDLLAQAKVLRKEEMVECPHCDMAALRSEYEDALEEDDEYACTSCDEPMPRTEARAITTYRRDEQWKDVTMAPKEDATEALEWTFAEQDGETRARNEALCHEYAAMGEQDILAISTRWRDMAVAFTTATKRSGHYHGHIVHDDEIPRVTKILETAVSQRGIDGVSRLLPRWMNSMPSSALSRLQEGWDRKVRQRPERTRKTWRGVMMLRVTCRTPRRSSLQKER